MGYIGHAFFVERPRTIDELMQPHLFEHEREYQIVKAIELGKMDYENFITDMLVDRQFIEDNAARNQLYASISEVVGRIGKEDAKLRGAAKKTSKIVSGITTPLYETELTQMQSEFRSIIIRLKKEFPSRVEEMKKLTREAFQNTVEYFTKGGEASQLMQVSEEEFAERFRQSLAYRFGYPFDDEVPQRKTAEHFLITRTRANKLEQEALRHFRVGLHWDTLDYRIDVEHDQQ